MLHPDLLDSARAISDRIVSLRRAIHAEPELGLHTPKTRDKVRAAGFSAFVEQVRTEKGTLHRVRVGPVANRGDAEQLKAQVAAKVGVAGMVRPHP